MKTRHYITTGLIAYALFLIISAPATAIYHLNSLLPQVKFQGLDGTLWSGHAQRVSIASEHILDDVNWSFCGWRLLAGELCLELDANYQDNPLYGQIGAGLGGSLNLRGLTTETDASLLGELLSLPIAQLSGLVSIEMTSVSWSRGSSPRAEGNITWDNAAITVAETANLGIVSIVLSESEEAPLAITINNKGGHVALNGHVNVIDDGTYNLELNLTPNNQATRNIRSTLEMFAKKQANGSFVLKNSGNLEQFGLM